MTYSDAMLALVSETTEMEPFNETKNKSKPTDQNHKRNSQNAIHTNNITCNRFEKAGAISASKKDGRYSTEDVSQKQEKSNQNANEWSIVSSHGLESSKEGCNVMRDTRDALKSVRENMRTNSDIFSANRCRVIAAPLSDSCQNAAFSSNAKSRSEAMSSRDFSSDAKEIMKPKTTASQVHLSILRQSNSVPIRNETTSQTLPNSSWFFTSQAERR